MRRGYEKSRSKKISLSEFITKTSTRLFSFNGESSQPAGSSKYSHRYTRGMGNYGGKALTTGCRYGNDCAVKTELMDLKTLQWTDGPDYPFASR